MRVLYPENPLDKTQADTPYQAEFEAVAAAGYACSLFDFDMLLLGEFRPRPRLEPGESILYRGWMFDAEGYQALAAQVKRRQAKLITSYDDYLRCHHLPNWYPQCAHLTAKTHCFAPDDEFEANLENLGWSQFFIKDFVKSNTTARGSIASSPAEASKIVADIAQHRGQIEGGIAVRQVESYRRNTEQRYFVVHGRPLSPDGNVPPIVGQIASIIDAPFYTADIVETCGGELRLVELGDGQVSDRKNWPLPAFVNVIAAADCP